MFWVFQTINDYTLQLGMPKRVLDVGCLLSTKHGYFARSMNDCYSKRLYYICRCLTVHLFAVLALAFYTCAKIID